MRIKAWTFFADVYCGICGDKLPEIDPEGNPKHPVFFTDEFAPYDRGDGVMYEHHCGECGEPASEW